VILVLVLVVVVGTAASARTATATAAAAATAAVVVVVVRAEGGSPNKLLHALVLCWLVCCSSAFLSLSIHSRMGYRGGLLLLRLPAARCPMPDAFFANGGWLIAGYCLLDWMPFMLPVNLTITETIVRDRKLTGCTPLTRKAIVNSGFFCRWGRWGLYCMYYLNVTTQASLLARLYIAPVGWGPVGIDGSQSMTIAS
jgi:hypothetical protein